MRGVAEQYHTLVWCSVPFVPRRHHPQPAHDEARVARTVWCIDERAQLLCPLIKVVSHRRMRPWYILGCRSAERAKG